MIKVSGAELGRGLRKKIVSHVVCKECIYWGEYVN